VWWRGAPYVPTGNSDAEVKDPELEIVNESGSLVDGVWRRMFEIDMRKDEADFSSREKDEELAELAEEIGELDGMEGDLDDFIDTSVTLKTNRLGNFISKSILPADWSSQLNFFEELETATKDTLKELRQGKKGEQLKFEELLRSLDSGSEGGDSPADYKARAAAVSEPMSVDAESVAVENAAAN